MYVRDDQKHVCNRLYKANHSIQESSCHLDNLKPRVRHRRIVQNDRKESHKPYNVQLVFDGPLRTMEFVILQSPRCVQQQDETDYLYGRKLMEKKSPVLKEYLEKAGFCQLQSHKNKKGWLCVTAQK